MMLFEVVKTRMKELEMPVADLATRSGVDRVTIDRFLAKRQSLGSDRLQKLVDVLDLELAAAPPRG